MEMAKIMVVDDEPSIVSVVKKTLEMEGHEVCGVNSGVECLNIVGEVRPDLILMDIMMPIKDGWETTKGLKEREDTKDIPVAMVTVRSSKDDKLKSFHDSRCDGYITKPLDLDELIMVVDWLLKPPQNR